MKWELIWSSAPNRKSTYEISRPFISIHPKDARKLRLIRNSIEVMQCVCSGPFRDALVYFMHRSGICSYVCKFDAASFKLIVSVVASDRFCFLKPNERLIPGRSALLVVTGILHAIPYCKLHSTQKVRSKRFRSPPLSPQCKNVVFRFLLCCLAIAAAR